VVEAAFGSAVPLTSTSRRAQSLNVEACSVRTLVVRSWEPRVRRTWRFLRSGDGQARDRTVGCVRLATRQSVIAVALDYDAATEPYSRLGRMS
jgi:hypothetical protein